jgi:hypothetical protein
LLTNRSNAFMHNMVIVLENGGKEKVGLFCIGF